MRGSLISDYASAGAIKTPEEDEWAEQPRAAGRHTVLVIDDDPCLLPLMTAAFALRGFRALSAENGEIGMRVFRAEAPDLVVTDIVMPEKDGIATIMELKRCPEPPKVIAISGGARISSHDCLKWARHLGADETLPKPFCMSALIGVAHQLLAQQSSTLHSI